jgi:glycerate-2-kinase
MIRSMKSDLMALYRSAIAAVDPYRCVKDYLLRLTGDHQIVSSSDTIQLRLENQSIEIKKNLHVVAFGKAALSNSS